MFAQVDAASGLAVRTLPARLARGFVGLRRFARVTLETLKGRRIASEELTFCPNLDRQRVSDEGPLLSRYPAFCPGGFPFVRGMVWGVDAGWSASLSPQTGLTLRSRELRPGAYMLAMRMTAVYRNLLEIPEDAARATVRVKVRKVSEGRGGHAVEELEPGPTEVPVPASARPTPAAVPNVELPDPETMPDLAALPAFDVSLRNRRGRNILRFAANSWNPGPSDVVIEGFRGPDGRSWTPTSTSSTPTGRPSGARPWARSNTTRHGVTSTGTCSSSRATRCGARRRAGWCADESSRSAYCQPTPST
jgi:hypothetical protein